MTVYLHVITGPYRYLVDSAQIMEMWVEGESDDRPIYTGVKQAWRGHKLDVLDCRKLFGLSGFPRRKPRTKIVTESTDGDDGDNAGIILTVDSVAGLEKAEPPDFLPLPPSLGKASHFFDAVLSRPVDGRQLLRWNINASEQTQTKERRSS